jgi:hypothetical protein
VGGTGGYEEFLAALSDPLHEEHDSYLAWVGYKFDPAVFNVAVANAALQRVLDRFEVGARTATRQQAAPDSLERYLHQPIRGIRLAD